jgi:hypothetical protein
MTLTLALWNLVQRAKKQHSSRHWNASTEDGTERDSAPPCTSWTTSALPVSSPSWNHKLPNSFLGSQTTQAERAIRTFKTHFITGLCSTDPDFSFCLWDELLPQAELTLNLLRGSRLNPRISAWAARQSVHDFCAHPLGLPGCKMVVLDLPGQRGSWDPHGKLGWYVGPSFEHYRVHHICAKDTKRIWHGESLQWFPSHVTMPSLSTHAQLEAAVHDLAQVIRQWPSLYHVSSLHSCTSGASH